MTQVEGAYKCASVCYVPLFYLTLDVSEGRVEEDCATAAVDALASQTGIGVACVITAVLLFCAWLGSLPLCCGFEKNEMNADGEEGH